MIATFFKTLWGMITAFIRLIFLVLIFFLTGLQHILFNRSEISGMSMVLIPQRQDREKVAYINKLRCGNVDLATGVPIPDSMGVPFRSDAEFDDDDIDFRPEDVDDLDDDNDDDEDDSGDEGAPGGTK